MENNDHGKVLISWKIKEYQQYERKRGWYITAGIIGFGLLAYAVWTFNFLFAFIIILFGIIIYLQTKKKPEDVTVNVTEDGLEIGDTFFPYSTIEKFWIIFEPPEVKNLYLNINRVLRPEISIDLGKANPIKVRDALLTYLEEDLEQEDESGPDYLSRQMKF
ncbi:MAG: hypothetical protein KKA99_03980 [Gammaproteobacteria bacterium]|nr:hypothetical protein [Gammaproteobacteria bacterium]MBU1673001.1 hypothetical protein [Patescibacteria group bacterium]MBU1964160.1 hypothetical protein [Patescibacteria group bacterium]